jgi:glycine/D-amino acid oxidase-like deaminating enzyme
MGLQAFDVVIAGGGIMGSSTAYHLTRKDKRLKVAVVEKDPSYVRSSTTLSMSNVRIQFSLKENIQISQYAFEVFKNFEEEMEVDGIRPKISLRQEGNLFLVPPEGEKAAREAFALQRSLGCRIEWWSNEEIRRHYPLYQPEGLAGGTFGPDDGHFDAYAALMGYKKKARSQGVVYFEDEVVALEQNAGVVRGVRLAKQGGLSAKQVVNCEGAWASQLTDTVGIKLPVVPTKRQVFVLDTAVKPAGPLPLTVLPSGLYFRTETGGVILLGKSMPEDPVGFDFTWDEKRFMEILWPELAGFAPAWESLKLVRGWAGLYAVNTLDHNAILGEWPGLKGFYLANGFSGHGLQQAPAVGRYISELILGQAPRLDLAIFTPKRILENKPISEGGIV